MTLVKPTSMVAEVSLSSSPGWVKGEKELKFSRRRASLNPRIRSTSESNEYAVTRALNLRHYGDALFDLRSTLLYLSLSALYFHVQLINLKFFSYIAVLPSEFFHLHESSTT